MPRAVLVRMLGTRGALEYEIGIFISERAWDAARRLIDERERPDDDDDLYSRAIRACYRTLQRQIMTKSRQILSEAQHE